MIDTTLLFLIKKNENQISHICLAMKKRGFGAGRWNGAGGKVDSGESTEEATIRETEEEIGVKVDKEHLHKIAEFIFYFPNNKEWEQTVSVYFVDKWEGEPSESEEMKPEWFSIDTIPFAEMWPDDPLWIPRVLGGELLKGSFTFGEGDKVLEHHLEEVKSF